MAGEAQHVENPTHIVYVREVCVYRVEFTPTEGRSVREEAEAIVDEVRYDLLSNFMEVQERDIADITDIHDNEFWSPIEESAE